MAGGRGRAVHWRAHRARWGRRGVARRGAKEAGLAAKALEPEAISAAHIASLAGTEAKLVCLCYLGAGTGPAHIRYLVRRLRRILPQGTAILVAYFAGEGGTNAVKELSATAEADAYATSLQDAAGLSAIAAKGELKIDAADEALAPTATRDGGKVHAPADPDRVGIS